MMLLLIIVGGINFYIQPVVYYVPLKIKDSLGIETETKNIYYIEFNCAIPYNELYYQEVDGKIIADCITEIKLVNRAQGDSLVDSLYHQFTIPSFSQAAKEGLTFYLQFGKYLTVGEYEYIITLYSGNNTGNIQGKKTITEKDHSLSDILLARAISYDTTGGFLTKGNLKIIPNPSGIFDEGTEYLYIYYELYNITPDSTALKITYSVVDTAGNVVKRASKILKKRFSNQAINSGFNIETLKPGDYKFKVVIEDSSSKGMLEKAIDFQIREMQKRLEVVEELPYYDAIEYFVSKQEYQYFLTLEDEGRRMYLKKFWEKHNYNEIAQRCEYADIHFQEGTVPGLKTDRGRIYIKFGPPDEVENRQWEESNPYEYWQYYNGLEFIFVDVRGTQEYTLVWTNALNEKSNPAMYKYLPVFKRRELEEKKE